MTWTGVINIYQFINSFSFCQFEGYIMKGNEDLVHHIEVFHCEVGPNEKVPYYNGPGLAEGKPKGLEVCRKVIGAWAMGASVSLSIFHLFIFCQNTNIPLINTVVTL